MAWLAAVALAVQITAAASVPQAEFRAASANWLVAHAICHFSGTDRNDGNSPADHKSSDCSLCPLCQAVTHASLLPPPPETPAPPPPRRLRLAMLAPAQGPPARSPGAALPRGPPVPV